MNYLCRACLKEQMIPDGGPDEVMTLECPNCGHRVRVTLFPITPNWTIRNQWFERWKVNS